MLPRLILSILLKEKTVFLFGITLIYFHPDLLIEINSVSPSYYPQSSKTKAYGVSQHRKNLSSDTSWEILASYLINLTLSYYM